MTAGPDDGRSARRDVAAEPYADMIRAAASREQELLVGRGADGRDGPLVAALLCGLNPAAKQLR